MKERLYTEVIELLLQKGYLDSPKITPNIKPGHGPCCTCQKCGYHHDDCVCYNNDLLRGLNKIFDVE